MIMINVYKDLTKYSDHSSVRRNSVHTTSHILYIYSYILLIHFKHIMSTYIHIIGVSMYMNTLLRVIASLTLG